MRTQRSALSPRDQLMGMLIVLVWLTLALVLRDSYKPDGHPLPGHEVRPVTKTGEPDRSVHPPPSASSGAKPDSDR